MEVGATRVTSSSASPKAVTSSPLPPSQHDSLKLKSACVEGSQVQSVSPSSNSIMLLLSSKPITSLLGLLFLLFTAQCFAVALTGKPARLIRAQPTNDGLQDIVTWDTQSLFVRGERILFYSGEFHPFRLPVPGLWLDVFEKIKALGYSGVSFYVDWALLEGEPGTFTAEGIFSLEPFFAAASQAGIYLLARPGPYINAEVSGGGFPGWLQRINGTLRTNDTSYLDATQLYVQSVGKIIAAAQITNGGPVVLLQPENEYTQPANHILFPNHEYFAYVEQQYRNAGIVVPFISNDAAPEGFFSPGNGTGSVDIYGHDSYPLGFDCANPYTWPDDALPMNFHALHELESPTTPYSIVEFQGGSFDPWGGQGFAKCTALLGSEFERVFYKNDFSFGVTIFNLYMTYGGTNWGNLGHPGGYTSYDYGAAIKEDRTVAREKYSEAKLLANFLKVSPAYLTASPGTGKNGSYTSTNALAVTPLSDTASDTIFYVVRHAAYNSLKTTKYTLSVLTSMGGVTIPQIGNASLTLNGRDSKIHVTDYNLAGFNLIYCTAEIFTWEKTSYSTVLVLYGGAGETHEFALPSTATSYTATGGNVTAQIVGSNYVVQWVVTPEEKVLTFAEVGLTVYLLWRNDVYNWWTLELPASSPVNNFTSPSKSSVIVKGGYLMRSASISGSTVNLVGDVNATTTLTVIGGAPSCKAITFNNQSLKTSVSTSGVLSAQVTYTSPTILISTLSNLAWKTINSLPEISSSYDDSLWTLCNHTTSNNPLALKTPTSLYASDYGYNGGSLIYRGHFTADPVHLTPSLHLLTQGGTAYGHSIWLNGTFVASYPGVSTALNHSASYSLPRLTANKFYTLTVLIDHMGLDENFNPGLDSMKNPRGILSFNLTNYLQSAISWKMTGNLGGEAYRDKTRGPLNEGALWAERQGYHLPLPPSSIWKTGSPLTGISSPGVQFYTTSFNLSLSAGYDIPLSFVFTNTTSSSSPVPFRAQLFVNGYQFGKYVNHIGPQTSYPVPEGILNYKGTNYVAVSLWAMQKGGAKIGGLALVAGEAVMSGRGAVELSPMPAWTARSGAY